MSTRLLDSVRAAIKACRKDDLKLDLVSTNLDAVVATMDSECNRPVDNDCRTPATSVFGVRASIHARVPPTGSPTDVTNIPLAIEYPIERIAAERLTHGRDIIAEARQKLSEELWHKLSAVLQPRIIIARDERSATTTIHTNVLVRQFRGPHGVVVQLEFLED